MGFTRQNGAPFAVIPAMPNELIVGAVQPLTGSTERPVDSRAEPYPTPTAPTPSEAPQLFVNPTLTFDSRLGLLVIQFHDESGNVSTSIPSQRQLEAYRLHQQPLPGQQPATPHVTSSDVQVPSVDPIGADTPAANGATETAATSHSVTS
jgi:hypothetical protein